MSENNQHETHTSRQKIFIRFILANIIFFLSLGFLLFSMSEHNDLLFWTSLICVGSTYSYLWYRILNLDEVEVIEN